jgi:hypothetical protein
MKENRKLKRFELDIPARLLVTTDDQKKEVIELKTANISAGGAFLQTEHRLPEGTRVQLDIVLPVEKIKELIGMYGCVTVIGSVTRSEPEGIAVVFDNKYEIMPYRR